MLEGNPFFAAWFNAIDLFVSMAVTLNGWQPDIGKWVKRSYTL